MQSVSVRVDKEQHQLLKAAAKRRGMLINALLRKILEQYFKNGATDGR